MGYHAATDAAKNAIEQCDLKYKNLIIICMLLHNATLPKLRESLEQDIGFWYWDVIPNEPTEVASTIMK